LAKYGAESSKLQEESSTLELSSSFVYFAPTLSLRVLEREEGRMSLKDREHQSDSLLQEPRRVWWIWLVYLLLYAVAIPWYWPENYRGPLILGFPLWVAVSLSAFFLVSAWTAFVALRFWQLRDGEE
jgi:polyferredoxin